MERHLHYRGPDIDPDLAHMCVLDDLRKAAESLWQPGELPDTYTTNRSAAGEALAAHLPSAEHSQDNPHMTLVVDYPAKRTFEAFSRVLAHHGRARTATFIVLGPHADGTPSRGVICRLSDPASDHAFFEAELSPGMFLHFMDIAGLCEPANLRQRIGRRAAEGFTRWMESEAAINEHGGRRGMGNFNAW